MALTSKSRRGDSNPEPSVYKTPSGVRAGASGRGAVRPPAGFVRAGAGSGGHARGRAVAFGSRPGPLYLDYDDPEPPRLSEWQTLRRRVGDALTFWGTLAALVLASDWLL